MLLGWELAEKATFREALSELNQAFRLDDNPQVIAWLGYVYALAGQHEDAKRIVSDLQETAKRRYMSPYDVAPICAALRENEQAIQWLERVYEDRSGWLAWWLKVDPDSKEFAPSAVFRIFCGGSVTSRNSHAWLRIGL